MSRFTKELRVIPKATWIIGWLIYACFTLPLFFFVVPTDQEIGKWPRWGQALFVYGIFLILVALVALIGYVYGDAKRRQMRYVVWTLLVIFIPCGVGLILYFVLRDPLPNPCAGCGNIVKTGLPFCPHCGTVLQPMCSSCGKPVDLTWANCAYCGKHLPMQASLATQNQGLET